jgi:hypothetical protein
MAVTKLKVQEVEKPNDLHIVPKSFELDVPFPVAAAQVTLARGVFDLDAGRVADVGYAGVGLGDCEGRDEHALLHEGDVEGAAIVSASDRRDEER